MTLQLEENAKERVPTPPEVASSGWGVPPPMYTQPSAPWQQLPEPKKAPRRWALFAAAAAGLLVVGLAVGSAVTANHDKNKTPVASTPSDPSGGSTNDTGHWYARYEQQYRAAVRSGAPSASDDYIDCGLTKAEAAYPNPFDIPPGDQARALGAKWGRECIAERHLP